MNGEEKGEQPPEEPQGREPRGEEPHGQRPSRRSPDEPARDPRRGLHPVILVICIVVFVFLFFLIRDVRTEYVGEYGSENSAPESWQLIQTG